MTIAGFDVPSDEASEAIAQGRNLRVSVTVLIAAKNEAANIGRCVACASPATRIIVLDSGSTDGTVSIARELGAEIVQFVYRGGYPKKRQWALDNVPIQTEWVLLLDADEFVPPQLWKEISVAIGQLDGPNAYLITKGFHFLGRRFRFGGFSHSAVLLLRPSAARFEELLEDNADGQDMEVHERVLVAGQIGKLRTPLIHEDFKGLEAYIARHNKYSTWEARLRHRYLTTGQYGRTTIRPKLFGTNQQRRRFLKRIAIQTPCEPLLWFVYHYVLRLGFLEGKPGFIASRIRASYIAQVRAKIYELQLKSRIHEAGRAAGATH